MLSVCDFARFLFQAPTLDYSWFLQRKRWVSTKVLTRVFIVNTLILPLYIAVTTAVLPEMFEETLLDGCPAGGAVVHIRTFLILESTLISFVARITCIAVREKCASCFAKLSL